MSLHEHRSIHAVAEGFFATVRAELLDDESYATRKDAESSI